MKSTIFSFLGIALLPQIIFFSFLPDAQAQKICTELGGSQDVSGGSQGLSLTLTGRCKWDKKNITVKFLDGEQSVKEKVKKYAKKWEKYANIKFDFISSGSTDVRISFKKSGSWSCPGKCPCKVNGRYPTQNEPTMNFGWLKADSSDNEYSRVVLHEFGHALGFVHEHQNPGAGIPWNEPAAIKYYAETQGWSEKETRRNVFAKYSENETNFSDYDKYSIMHYAIPDKFTKGNFSVPWNNTSLSATDKKYASLFYPEVFIKNGNNGTVSCNIYCGATRANNKPKWGSRTGYCIKAKHEYTGKEVSCNSVPGLINDRKQLTCFCASGTEIRHGNNGTISCNAFCERTKETCIAGWNNVTNHNRDASCTQVPGYLNGPEITCTCVDDNVKK